MADKIDPRDHIPLSRTMAASPGDEAWARWQAGIDAAHAARHGAPSPATVALAMRLAEQERILFGRVVTRELRAKGE